MENALYFTYTCPVSRKTYAGHPRDGHLYTHDNDLEEAILTIHRLARKHGQPVTWVINDQEYTDQEGLLRYFRQFQAEGDAVLVTMELTTSPPDVGKYDTAGVIRWIDGRCRDAGLRIDGLWSLRFLESDLAAIRALDSEEFAWTRNLAGSCWHQIGIDDSTWGGCPYNPYYPSPANVRSPAQSGEPRDFLMLEWLSRDIPAILAGGFPATFSLDPADSNRRDAGGFDNESDALRYSNALIHELAAQAQANRTVVINVNEEARHFQTEGHDKAYMLDGMFRCAGQIAGTKRVTYRELFDRFRKREPEEPARLFVCRSVDWRAPEDVAALYEDAGRQMGFLRSSGSLPVEWFDYSARHPGEDSNAAYPQASLDGIKVLAQRVTPSDKTIEVEFRVHSHRPVPEFGLVAWDTEAEPLASIAEAGTGVLSAKVGLYGCVFVLSTLGRGENLLRVTIRRQ